MMCIENRLPCPRCGHKRFVQRAKDAYVCFQCRNTWSSTQLESHPVDVLAQFLPHERARMIAYRGAVQCGLYTDWPVAEPDVAQVVGPTRSIDGGY
jgi:DNA-directed RNA polymerase subunit RPC12/RpoP